jgi:tetratricopeptide (TPR) repeat protein
MGDIYRLTEKTTDKAEKAYSKGVEILNKLAGEILSIPNYQSDLAKCYSGLGVLYAITKNEEKSKSGFDKAVELWERLTKNYPGEIEFIHGLSTTWVQIGNMAKAKGKPKDAVFWYTRAVNYIDAKHQQQRENARIKIVLRSAHWMRAETLTLQGPYPKAQEDWKRALEDWKRALELTPEGERPFIQLARATAMARSGKHEEATKEASTLLETRKGGALYRLAVVYSLSAAAVADPKERQELAEQYASRAVALLASAKKNGYFKTPANRAAIQNDADLKSLRDRPDFKKLLTELEEK